MSFWEEARLQNARVVDHFITAFEVTKSGLHHFAHCCSLIHKVLTLLVIGGRSTDGACPLPDIFIDGPMPKFIKF